MVRRENRVVYCCELCDSCYQDEDEAFECERECGEREAADQRMEEAEQARIDIEGYPDEKKK